VNTIECNFDLFSINKGTFVVIKKTLLLTALSSTLCFWSSKSPLACYRMEAFCRLDFFGWLQGARQRPQDGLKGHQRTQLLRIPLFFPLTWKHPHMKSQKKIKPSICSQCRFQPKIVGEKRLVAFAVPLKVVLGPIPSISLSRNQKKVVKKHAKRPLCPVEGVTIVEQLDGCFRACSLISDLWKILPRK